MKKLIPEQTQWLIEQINNGLDKCCNIMHDLEPPHAAYSCIIKIINQCTEKEFPTFQWISPDDSDEFVQLVLHCEGDDETEAVINFNTPTGYVRLFASEFKQFADGAAKIKEWIDAK